VESSLEQELASANAEAAALDVEEPPHVAFMNLHFAGLDHDIIDGTLTSGNCHGLTFGAGGSTFISFTTVPGLLAQLKWEDGWVDDKSADILVCFQGNAIGHTATKAGSVWRQTLPAGPLFTSTLEALETKYDCFDLSTKAGREGVQKKHAAVVAELNALRKELIAECNTPTGDEDLNEHYMPDWKKQARAKELDASQMKSYIEQIKDAR
jgi:hypothetical protein